jgi:hypothetical protein
MLGNVYQWTSSVPRLYPGSAAERQGWFGKPGYRVLRGASYGTGMASAENGVLDIRNTTRFLAYGPNDGWTEGARYETIGFRCAKEPVPAADVVRHQLENSWFVLPHAPPFGVERNRYVVPAEGDDRGVFVVGRTSAVGVAPVADLPFVPGWDVVKASRREPVILAFLALSPDLSLADAEPYDPVLGLVISLVEGRLEVGELGARRPRRILALGALDASLAPARRATIDVPERTVSISFPVAFGGGGPNDVLPVEVSLPLEDVPAGSWRETR